MESHQNEKKYEELKKKLNLPDFKKLDREFEISDLEDTNFLLNAIVRRIAERADFYTTMLEEILQPDASNLYVMHEIRFFDEKDKKEMYDLYSRLMAFNRQSIEVLLGTDDEIKANFINELMGEWETIRKSLLVYVKKMKSSWNDITDVSDDVEYMG